MASRSFKPASYLASAAQAPSRSPRPSFTRSSSNSSTLSTQSEDSTVATLRSLGIDGKGRDGAGPPRSATPGSSSSSVTPQQPETPGRKKSDPIAIELPSRGTAAYTPLSARGDLPGGYFPNHEEVQKSYRSHPFSNHLYNQQHNGHRSPTMTMSPGFTPSSEATPTMPTSAFTTAFGQLSPAVPEPLRMPMGKYHPSNYQSPSSSTVTTPLAMPRPSLPPSTLSIPPPSSRLRAKDGPGHERKTSDIKRKIQQYQRDMIAQARSAANSTRQAAARKEPISPRLEPLGSPGPITPFELEEADGYITAGSPALRKENERQLEMMRNEIVRNQTRGGVQASVERL